MRSTTGLLSSVSRLNTTLARASTVQPCQYILLTSQRGINGRQYSLWPWTAKSSRRHCSLLLITTPSDLTADETGRMAPVTVSVLMLGAAFNCDDDPTNIASDLHSTAGRCPTCRGTSVSRLMSKFHACLVYISNGGEAHCMEQLRMVGVFIVWSIVSPRARWMLITSQAAQINGLKTGPRALP